MEPSLLEFIKEVPDFLNLGLDELFDFVGFIRDFLCGCRSGLAEDLSEVRFATSVPSQSLPNIYISTGIEWGIQYREVLFPYILGV